MGRLGLLLLSLAAVAAAAVNLGVAATTIGQWLGAERLVLVDGSSTPETHRAADAAGERAAARPPRRPVRTVDLSQDPLLTSPMLAHPGFRAEVHRWIGIWSGIDEDRFSAYLARMRGFETMVDSVLAEKGLPWSLRYLPIIESGYDPTAVSHASAVGMWQFMAPTAGDFGVAVTRLVDDRRDPLESTVAAAGFLSDLHAEFDSWFLALAAYNAGPGRVRQLIARHAPGATLDDALYWRIRPHLPKETQAYVPNLFGAIYVAANPESYGHETPIPVPFEYERVPVLGRIDMATVARLTGTTVEEIERLNPEYLQGVTPDREVVDLRLPTGKAQSFRDYFAAAPEGPGGGAP